MPKPTKRRQHCKQIASLGGRNSPHNHPTPSLGISPKSPLISPPKNKKRKNVPPTQWKEENEIRIHKRIKKSKKDNTPSSYQDIEEIEFQWEAIWRIAVLKQDPKLTENNIRGIVREEFGVFSQLFIVGKKKQKKKYL